MLAYSRQIHCETLLYLHSCLSLLGVLHLHDKQLGDSSWLLQINIADRTESIPTQIKEIDDSIDDIYATQW